MSNYIMESDRDSYMYYVDTPVQKTAIYGCKNSQFSVKNGIFYYNY